MLSREIMDAARSAVSAVVQDCLVHPPASPTQSDDLVLGFQHFRRRSASSSGSTATRTSMSSFTFHVTGLDSIHRTKMSPGLSKILKKKSLGKKVIKIQRNRDRQHLLEKIVQSFPSFAGKELDLLRASKDQGMTFKKIVAADVNSIRRELGRSMLYVRGLPSGLMVHVDVSDEDEPDETRGRHVQSVSSDLQPLRRPTARPRSRLRLRRSRQTQPLNQEVMITDVSENLPDITIVPSSMTPDPQILMSHENDEIPDDEIPSQTQTSFAEPTSRERRRTAIQANDFIHAVTSSYTNTNRRGIEERSEQDEESLTSSSQPLPQVGSQQLMDIARDLTDATSTNDIGDFIPEVAPVGDNGHVISSDGLQAVLKEHAKNVINTQSEDPFHMEVRRGFVLADALALIRFSQDDLHNPLKISFCGENGVDLGGLRREFWSLLLHGVAHSSYVTGKTERYTLQPNFLEKKRQTFYHLGQLIALSILQDGPGLPIFSDAVTDYILDDNTNLLSLDDLPDRLRTVLKEMEDCASDRELINKYCTIADDAMDVGFLVPMTAFKKDHVKPLQAAFIEHQISSCSDELNQFIKGLDTHQVLGVLRQEQNRKISRCLFSGRVKPTTVTKVRNLLRFKYNEGNVELVEKATGQGFLTFLQATKGTATSINGIGIEPKDVLMWLTGSTSLPAVGFHKQIDVEFGDTTMVNTCALVLTLKRQANMTPSDAVPYYTELMINSQTFTKE